MLLPFQGALLLLFITQGDCPGLGASALSGRSVCVSAFQGVLFVFLPFQGVLFAFLPFRAFCLRFCLSGHVFLS